MTFVESLRDRVGEQIFVSDPFEVRQTDIDVFAAVTHDWDYMHNDPVWAAEASPWGRATIAHGYYLVSLLMYFHGLFMCIAGPPPGQNPRSGASMGQGEPRENPRATRPKSSRSDRDPDGEDRS